MKAVSPGLEVLTSEALVHTRHGFFTRRGGASSGIFAGLNCGGGSSDRAEIVAVNRARVADAMGVGIAELICVHQTHSAIAVPVSGPFADKPRADAMATNEPGLALAVLTADCQPVLFADRAAGVVGAAHAGWRGTLDGVLEATVDAMERLGARRTRIAAVIGPSISQANYEVGPEFLERLFDEDPANARLFVEGTGGRYLFDLPGYGLMRLRAAGVASADWIRRCTYADESRFYSYRRSGHRGEADYGRLISAIRL